jgi:hypothetical protein
MSPKDYQERYCLFLDILGFKEIVEESASSRVSRRTGTISGIHFSLKKIADGLTYKSPFSRKSAAGIGSSRVVTQFSDSVVVSYLVKQIGSLEEMLYDILHLQLSLVYRGIFIRGAVTKGKLYHDADFVFGPALNEAVELEKVAMYPRVIVERELLSEAGLISEMQSAKTAVRTAESLVTRDLDGVYFVDYFAVHPEDFDDDWGELGEYLLDLRDLIKGLSSRRQASLRLKHSWLRQKFNPLAADLENSDFQFFNGHRLPEDEESHFGGVVPFR